ncbi:MAG TPA: phage major capsid protein [Candidatus Pelethocola excrementipullorum]|nr:phage major capsid protein [Candidatus Pelethocola excrementipullorum]
MKIDGVSKELQEKVKQMLNDAKPEDKAQAIYDAADMIVTAKNEKLIKEITEQSAKAAYDAEYRKTLNLPNLSQKEKDFYEKFKDIKQAVTAQQIDIIPNEIIDRTLDNVKKASNIMKLINFAPANVKKWLVASKTGAAAWGDLTGPITGELSATFTSLNTELHKMTVFLVIPKAIKDLALPFVDKYFTAILSEAVQDGLVQGYLDGDGKNAPIGIMRQIETTNSDGTNKAKTVLTNITKFSPKGLAAVRKTLSNKGLRTVGTLYLICNPNDEAEFVDPALYGEALTGGYRNTSFMPIEKIVDANVPLGKAIITIEKAYVMGMSSVHMKTYEETKAMDDADVIIGKVYANGRALDDDTAVVFDVTKLEEYVLPVTQVTTPTP